MILDETFPASYKGASFLAIKTTTAGGRKDVLHEYPNSDKQSVEDLGLKPRTLTIEGVINSPRYTEKKNQLLQALESGGSGLLVHPFFGNLEQMACRSYTLNENFTELGDAKISMTFTVSNAVPIPTGARNNASFINGKNNAVQSAMNADLANGFDVGNDASLFERATETMNRMFDKIDDATSIVSQATDAANEFSALLNGFATNINDLARKPQDFADSIQNVIANVNGLYATAGALSVTGNQSVTSVDQQTTQSSKTLAVFESMFDFDDNIVVAPNTTANRLRRNLNNDLMKQQIQANALGFGYLNATQIQFGTVDEINQVENRLEAQFQKVKSINDDIQCLVEQSFENIPIDTSTIDAMQDLRNATQEFFENARLTTRSVIEVDTKETTAPLLAFQYYGNTVLEQDIIELNPEQNVSFYSGTVKILSA
jgi:prophage DNA circulation protein